MSAGQSTEPEDIANARKREEEKPQNAKKKGITKLIREGLIKPKVQMRTKPIELDNTPLKLARRQLHAGYIPNLPCREKEYINICHFLVGNLKANCGGCMYVSGVPGTGKTATVENVISELSQMAQIKYVPDFIYIHLVGMHLTKPSQAYVEMYKQLTGKTLTADQALSKLDKKFTKKSKKTRLPIILLIDEFDIICKTRKQKVAYNIVNWASESVRKLIVLAIANKMDLPETELKGGVASRLGLTRLTFQSYTHKQLQEIVLKRLEGTDCFTAEAVELVARKVASVSGDVRRALDICRKAAELAESDGSDTLVTMSHMSKAIEEMFLDPKVRCIKRCSRLEQYILMAVVAEMDRTGVEETFFPNVYRTLQTLCSVNGFYAVSCTTALRAVSKLYASRLLLIDQKCSDMDQIIILNANVDVVNFALRED